MEAPWNQKTTPWGLRCTVGMPSLSWTRSQRSTPVRARCQRYTRMAGRAASIAAAYARCSHGRGRGAAMLAAAAATGPGSGFRIRAPPRVCPFSRLSPFVALVPLVTPSTGITFPAQPSSWYQGRWVSLSGLSVPHLPSLQPSSSKCTRASKAFTWP